MLAVALGLLGIDAVRAPFGQRILSIPLLLTLGVFLACLGLAAAVWRRPLVIVGTSVALVVVAGASWIAMVFRPDPPADPFLFAAGLWTHGPMPFRVGWARQLMGGAILVSGLALPLSMVRRPPYALLSLTIIRLTILGGAFWRLSYTELSGRFDNLVLGAAGPVQVTLVAAMVGSWLILLQGDRRWLGAMTKADGSVPIARFILPVGVAPMIGGYLVWWGVRLGWFGQDVANLLNIEATSLVLILIGSAALRSLWRDRRLRDSLSRAVERTPVIVHSIDGRIEHWPSGCEALYGYTAEEAIGRDSQELLKTESATPFEEILAALRSRGEWSGELRQTTRSGDRIWVTSRLLMDEARGDGDEKLVESITDISDLKQTYAALRDTSDSLSQAVAAYGLGIVEYDAETGQTNYSPEFARMVGRDWTALGPDQGGWRGLTPPADAERLMTWIETDVRNQATHRNLTIRARRPDGATRDLQGVVRYGFSADGGLRRIVWIFMDVTEQLRDRADAVDRGERLMALQTELAHTSRLSAMGEMAASLAHELNQPLTAVGNSVGVISLILNNIDRPVDESMRARILRAAKHAETQAVRAGEIVRRLREFIARGEADSTVEGLERLIGDAVALALPNRLATQVDVRTSIAPAAAFVLADRVQIQQVMVNLIRNAVEAMREQDKARVLTIEATAAGGMALIRVSDTGPGVAPDMVEKLFSPFLSTKTDGMGVGLSICQRIIEVHGGEMWYQPSDGGGAEFRFTLPLIAAPAVSSEGKHAGH